MLLEVHGHVCMLHEGKITRIMHEESPSSFRSRFASFCFFVVVATGCELARASRTHGTIRFDVLLPVAAGTDDCTRSGHRRTRHAPSEDW